MIVEKIDIQFSERLGLFPTKLISEENRRGFSFFTHDLQSISCRNKPQPVVPSKPRSEFSNNFWKFKYSAKSFKAFNKSGIVSISFKSIFSWLGKVSIRFEKFRKSLGIAPQEIGNFKNRDASLIAVKKRNT